MPPPVEGPRPAETAKPATETSNPSADAAKKAAKDNGARWKKMSPLRLLKAFATKKEPASPVQTDAQTSQPQVEVSTQNPVAAILEGERAQAQSETPVSQTPDVVTEPVGAEQPSNEVSVTSPVSNEPTDLAEERAQRGPDTTATTQTGPVSADTTQPSANPETQTPPDAETAARQEKAFQDINNRLNYVVEPNTNPAVLFSQLVKNEGWTPDAASANHVREAVAFAKNHASPEATASVRVAPASPDVQLEAFSKIDSLYKVTTDTDPAVLMANLVKNQGWEANAETAAYVQAAVDHVAPADEGSEAVIPEGAAQAETPAEEITPTNTTPEEPTEAARAPKTEIQLLREELAVRDAKIDILEKNLTELTEYLIAKENDPKKKKSLLRIVAEITGMTSAAMASDVAEMAKAEATGQQAA